MGKKKQPARLLRETLGIAFEAALGFEGCNSALSNGEGNRSGYACGVPKLLNWSPSTAKEERPR
jgi:hypothetical protein